MFGIKCILLFKILELEVNRKWLLIISTNPSIHSPIHPSTLIHPCIKKKCISKRQITNPKLGSPIDLSALFTLCYIQLPLNCVTFVQWTGGGWTGGLVAGGRWGVFFSRNHLFMGLIGWMCRKRRVADAGGACFFKNSFF